MFSSVAIVGVEIAGAVAVRDASAVAVSLAQASVLFVVLFVAAEEFLVGFSEVQR